MKIVHRLLRTGLALIAAPTLVHAQAIETLEYSIVWDKPVLLPGEVQTGHVWIKVLPDIGAAVQWNTSPGKGQNGTIAAIASSIFAIKNIENGQTGSMFQWSREDEWEVSPNFGGQPDGQQGILGINIGQISPPLNTTPITSAVVNVFWFKWDPLGNYSPREITYGVNATSGKVYLNVPSLGIPGWVGENAVLIGSQSSFQVIPAPAALILLFPCVPMIARRRRM